MIPTHLGIENAVTKAVQQKVSSRRADFASAYPPILCKAGEAKRNVTHQYCQEWASRKSDDPMIPAAVWELSLGSCTPQFHTDDPMRVRYAPMTIFSKVRQKLHCV